MLEPDSPFVCYCRSFTALGGPIRDMQDVPCLRGQNGPLTTSRTALRGGRLGRPEVRWRFRLFAWWAAAACAGDPAAVETGNHVRPPGSSAAGPPYELHAQAGGPFALGAPPTTAEIAVWVWDSVGHQLSGIKVTFVVDSGGGTISLPQGDTTFSVYWLRADWHLNDSVRRQVAHVEAGSLRSQTLAAWGEIGKVLLVSGNNQRARPGQAVPDPVVVRGTMKDGRPLGAGFRVWFQPLDTLGVIKAEDTALTAANGVATQPRPWVLETRPGTNTMVVRGLFTETAIRVTAEGVAPKPERIAVIAGDNSRGVAGGFLPGRPLVVVLDSSGAPMPGQPVQFAALEPRGTTRSYSRLRTDSLGRAAVSAWRLGQGIGLNQIEVSTPNLPPQPIALSATADTLPTPAFTIEAVYRGVVYLPIVPSVASAVAEWERIIVGDVPDVQVSLPADPAGCYPALNRTIDDLLLYVRVAPLDGPGNNLATVRVCRRRATGIPLISEIVLDYDDLLAVDNGAGLGPVITHLIGHALGFGTGWNQRPELVDPVRFRFLGQSAVQAVNWLRWTPFTGLLPMEWVSLGDGSDPATLIHWSDALAPDIMASTLYRSSWISIVTAAALRDLGYLVDDTKAAESFPVPANVMTLGPEIGRVDGLRHHRRRVVTVQ